MNEFMNAIKNRRSIYNISNEITQTNQQLQELIETAVNHVPSAFNSQTSRVILLTGDSHKQLWDITTNKLKTIVPADKFQPTKDKIASFTAGYGTILFFEEQSTIQDLQKQFPLYADNFPTWSQQSSGMLQFAIWTALESVGLGASLQHYNPLIDTDVSIAFHTHQSWKLIAQMPFGKVVTPAGEKEFIPIEERVFAYDKIVQ